MRIMALDIGDKRIGVAMSDPLEMLASPFTIVERCSEEEDLKAIAGLVKEHQVKQVIAGLPISLDGSIGAQAEKVKQFVARLMEQLSVPVEYQDESFTTFTARQLMRDTRSKKTVDKRRDDAFAATVILQTYLDQKRPAEPSP